jgi:hypothetical protein
VENGTVVLNQVATVVESDLPVTSVRFPTNVKIELDENGLISDHTI